jgi:hypothetical protein
METQFFMLFIDEITKPLKITGSWIQNIGFVSYFSFECHSVLLVGKSGKEALIRSALCHPDAEYRGEARESLSEF